MRVILFDSKSYDRDSFSSALRERRNSHSLHFEYRTERLNRHTAKSVEPGSIVCCFVNDSVDRQCLTELQVAGVQLVALRCAGYNQVDIEAATELGLRIVRVPDYSPHAVAEHAVALLLTLIRKTHKSYNRVRDGNFSLEGFVGFTIHAKTVSVIGTGRIGKVFAKLMLGFGARVLAHDIKPDAELIQNGVQYVSLNQAMSDSDIISLHVPLNPETFHFINADTLALTRPGVVLINTSRGKLIETKALIQCLKSGHLGAAGLDVYEEESEVFFENLSDQIIQDDVLMRLLTFPNVLVTSHQAFLTHEALNNIANTTLDNIEAFIEGRELVNSVT